MGPLSPMRATSAALWRSRPTTGANDLFAAVEWRTVTTPVTDQLSASVDRIVEGDLLRALGEYIAIPALSPAFDPAWQDDRSDRRRRRPSSPGTRAIAPIATSRVEIVSISTGGRRVLCCVVEPTDPTTRTNTLIYGHLDKQPPLGAWREGLGPFTPVREGDRLYGRGAADDGYALFTALCAIEALESVGGRHGRIVIVIEASEESGSPDLDAYIDHLAPVIGSPNLIICLDSGCLTYDRLWVTTSLRGLVTGTLRIAVMREGVHSGHAGGIAPSPSRLARLLLARIEDDTTGDVTLGALRSAIPTHRIEEMQIVASDLGEEGAGILPLLDGVAPEGDGVYDRIERGTWRAAVAVIGQEGLPPLADAGNVALPYLAIKLAVRIPPNVDPDTAACALGRRARHRSAGRRPRHLRGRPGRERLGRSTARPCAVGSARAKSSVLTLRPAVQLDRPRRVDPVPRDPRCSFSRRATSRHRSPRTGVERPRAE